MLYVCEELMRAKPLRHLSDFDAFGPTEKLWTENMQFMDWENWEGILKS